MSFDVLMISGWSWWPFILKGVGVERLGVQGPGAAFFLPRHPTPRTRPREPRAR